MTTAGQEQSEEAIRMAAYYLWLAEGQPEGQHELHWEKARQQLTAGMPAKKAAAKPAAPRAASAKKAATAKTAAKAEKPAMEKPKRRSPAAKKATPKT